MQQGWSRGGVEVEQGWSRGGAGVEPDTRIIRGHRLPISRYRDKLSATYLSRSNRGLKNRRLFYNIRFS